MNKYSYLSEKKARKLEMWQILDEYSEQVVGFYLANGFDSLAVSLNLKNNWERRVLFDYLILEKKAVLECVRSNKGFFLKIISEGKGALIRPMLGLKASKYNQIWLETLDLLNLYFVERKVDEKLFNFSLDKFFERSILNEENRPEELL